MAKISEDRLPHARNTEIGFVFQGFNLVSTLNALENVELLLTYRDLRKTERHELSREALRHVGLENRPLHRPGQMGGGRQQRAAIVKTITARPLAILTGEPAGNLDLQSGQKATEILKSLSDKGGTMVLIIHDDKVAAQAGRKIRVQDGRIIEISS